MKPIAILQNCEIESAGLISNHLREKKLAFEEIRTFAGEPLPQPDDISGLVILGTPISVLEYRRHQYLVDAFALITRLLRDDSPILGICFGAQILAHALGAKVLPNKIKEIGIDTVQFTRIGETDPTLAGLTSPLTVFQWHGDTFRTPFGADHLATSKRCKNQAFRKGSAIGLQFHVEVTPSDAAKWCEAYAEELRQEGLSANAIISDFKSVYDNLKASAQRLVDNWLSISGLVTDS